MRTRWSHKKRRIKRRKIGFSSECIERCGNKESGPSTNQCYGILKRGAVTVKLVHGPTIYSDIEDLIESQPVDKTIHEWEQSTVEAGHIMKH